MLVRKLNSTGIAVFRDFLKDLRENARAALPEELLTGPATSAPLDVEVRVTERTFCSRLELAEYLDRILKGDPSTLRSDAGFWTWLSAYWFESLCPVVNETRQPGNIVRWIADPDHSRRACRHLLVGPYQIYRAHRDDPFRALSLLCGPVQRTSALVRLIASRPSLATCRAVVGAATRLYYNPAAGRNRTRLNDNGPGSPRRFTDILSQLDLTWDLHSLSTDELLDLLPPEFDHFHRQPAVFSSCLWEETNRRS